MADGYLAPDDDLAVRLTAVIRSGDVDGLSLMLAGHPGLAAVRVGQPDGASRSLLHVVTDWPGPCPNGAASVTALVRAGANPNARFAGPHDETPLHWAASCDDVDVIDALLDAGADIEADGGVIAGGSPMADAVAFGQWHAARRLLARGALTNLWQAAALGLAERVEAMLPADAAEVTGAFWCACHGGQRPMAERLLGAGADRNWIGWDHLTPLDAAVRSGAEPLAAWLRSVGARTVTEVRNAT
jgi:uncharacterized protein